MKKIIMIVSMALATIGFSYAQQDQNMQQQEQPQMTSIDKEELPNEIKNSFETGELKEWEIEEAFEVIEGEADYAVKVKRGEESRILHFDSEGNLVKQENVKGSESDY